MYNLKTKFFKILWKRGCLALITSLATLNLFQHHFYAKPLAVTEPDKPQWTVSLLNSLIPPILPSPSFFVPTCPFSIHTLSSLFSLFLYKFVQLTFSKTLKTLTVP